MSEEREGLDDATRQRLAHLLDAIVPPAPDRGLPGAGEVGAADYVAKVVSESPELRPALLAGLDAADAGARERGADDFASLTPSDKTEVLQSLDTTAPGVVPVLVFHGYTAYYQNGRVMEPLGLEPRPPHPKGYTLESGDYSSLLEHVQARGKLYREP
jgi:hypothetical protein